MICIHIFSKNYDKNNINNNLIHQLFFARFEIKMKFLLFVIVCVFCFKCNDATLVPSESLVVELDENTEELPIRLIKKNSQIQNLTVINAYPAFVKFVAENLPKLHELNLVAYKDEEMGYFGSHFKNLIIFKIGFRGESLFPIGITFGTELQEFEVEVWSKIDFYGNLYDTDDKYIDLIDRNKHLKKLRIMAKRAESKHPFKRLWNIKTNIEKITFDDYKHISKDDIIQLIEHNSRLNQLKFNYKRVAGSHFYEFMKNIHAIKSELHKHFGRKWNIEVTDTFSNFSLDMKKINLN